MPNMQQYSRNVRLIGDQAQSLLFSARVAVFGLGGVGSYVCEALVRAGVGELLLVDGDCVEISNLNRQLIATQDTLGMPKSEAARLRALSINPEARVDARHVLFNAENAGQFDFTHYDYIVDAIDDVRAKLLLIERARAAGRPILCSMGAGNKLDPSRFQIAEIEKTTVCPLARVMRRELKKRGISGVRVVYSTEPARPSLDGGRAPGSLSFVPAAAGLVLAGAVIRDLIGALPETDGAAK